MIEGMSSYRLWIIPAHQQNDKLPQTCWLQQDGVPCHYDQRVMDYLDATFPYQWIGCRGFIKWPAHSPGFRPPDFFEVWTHVLTLGDQHACRIWDKDLWMNVS